METPGTTIDTAAAPSRPVEVDAPVGEADEDVVDDLLVEEISIDGMCGVY
ncbi:MAG: mycofactocin precursor MftA [Acidimicrobiia bacterium]